MVESLADIQIATTLLKKQTVEITENPIDTNYKSLHCGLVPLDHNSDEFEMITTYVENTHAKTHSWYELEVDEVYVVDREGEKERFLGNKYPEKKRKLLWHGSRLTNFAGILSQGLRIAPPEVIYIYFIFFMINIYCTIYYHYHYFVYCCNMFYTKEFKLCIYNIIGTCYRLYVW